MWNIQNLKRLRYTEPKCLFQPFTASSGEVFQVDWRNKLTDGKFLPAVYAWLDLGGEALYLGDISLEIHLWVEPSPWEAAWLHGHRMEKNTHGKQQNMRLLHVITCYYNKDEGCVRNRLRVLVSKVSVFPSVPRMLVATMDEYFSGSKNFTHQLLVLFWQRIRTCAGTAKLAQKEIFAYFRILHAASGMSCVALSAS